MKNKSARHLMRHKCKDKTTLQVEFVCVSPENMSNTRTAVRCIEKFHHIIKIAGILPSKGVA
jgi:hypothetical protein